MKKTFKSPALRFTYHRTIKGKPEREASYEAELANAKVARKLYDLRTKAGLSQRGLAKLVGHNGVGHLPPGGYGLQGHSLAMLRRIAEALNKRVEIRFVPLRRAAGEAVRV